MAKKEVTAKHGKHKILMFRLLEEASKKGAAKLALQTEHTWKYERSTDQKMTKDGAITIGGGLKVSLDIKAVASTDEVNALLKAAAIDGKKLEVWEVDLSAKGEDGKYEALYARGDLSSWEVPANVENIEEISTSMQIDDQPKAGKVTLTMEQEEMLAYVFRDTAAVVGG